jgi:hypothetical protein
MNTEDRERLVRIEENVKTLVARGVDHEDRIRTVEKRSWFVAGAALLLSTVAPGITKNFI